MDYPKSVPGVGLVDGKFVDEDAVSGQVGSLIPSAWGNSVTDELLNVLGAAGVAPDEADRGQVLKGLRIIFAALDSPALKGTPTAPTPPQFDNSQKLATTATVQRALGNFSNAQQVNGNFALTAAMAGQSLMANVYTGPSTWTFPSIAAMTPGVSYKISNFSGFLMTLSPSGADKFISGFDSSGAAASYTVPNGEDVVVTALAGVWLVSGTADFGKSQFGASLTSTGYQKLPSGLILQWGTIQSGSGGVANLTFPIAFPDQLFNITVAEINSGAGFASAGTFSTAGGPINVWAPSGTSGGAGISVSWIAIGK
jgi:hypothetical protein